MWRKAQSSRIASLYVENEEVRAQFHSALALAFVPEDHVANAFMELRENADENLDDVLDLIEDYYILGRRRGRRRQAPRFPPAAWNVRERTLQGIPRTKNLWRRGIDGGIC